MVVSVRRQTLLRYRPEGMRGRMLSGALAGPTRKLGHCRLLASSIETQCGRKDTVLHLVYSECRKFLPGGVALVVWGAAPQMSLYIVEAAVGSMLEDDFQTRMALRLGETTAQNSLIEKRRVQSPVCWATGFDRHHALVSSVDCQMETRERRIHLSE